MGRIWMIAELMVRDHFVMTHQAGAPCQVWAKDWRGESAVVCIFSWTSTLNQICYVDIDTAAV